MDNILPKNEFLRIRSTRDGYEQDRIILSWLLLELDRMWNSYLEFSNLVWRLVLGEKLDFATPSKCRGCLDATDRF